MLIILKYLLFYRLFSFSKVFIFCLTTCLLYSTGIAQSDKSIDSVLSLKDDSLKVSLMTKMSRDYKDIDTKKGLSLGYKALEISKNLDFKFGIAHSHKAIGLNYWRMSEYDNALENYFTSLELFEELKDTLETARLNNNIGIIYFSREQYPKATQYLEKSIQISKLLNSYDNISRSLHNLGLIAFDIKDYHKSISYFQKSCEMTFKTSDSMLRSANYSFIGKNFTRLKMFDSAYYYLDLSKKYGEKLHNKNHIAMVYNQFADYYNSIKDFKKSLEFSELGYQLGSEIGNNYLRLEAFDQMHISYSGLKDYKKAYDYHIKYFELWDTLKNDENIKSVAQKEIRFEYDKKMKQLDLEKNNELYANEITLRIVLIGSALLALISMFIFWLYRSKTKANKQLIDSNNEINKQKEELTDLNILLQESNQTKDKFFSIIAHDLKNPLGNFRNVLNILSGSYDNLSEQDKTEFINLMKESADNIYELLENLLTWARSQRGAIEFHPTELDIREMITNTITLNQPLAERKQIKIQFDSPKDFKAFIDPNLFNTVVRNILTNAIKFTPENGLINVSLSYNVKEFSLVIEDNGIGIDEIALQSLFKIGEIKSRPGTNKEKGTGLGLILSKDFIDKHNGNITIESKVNHGTKFIITIPRMIY